MLSTSLARLKNRRDDEGGFTLIELLVVVVILGILIGIAIPVYLNYRKSANDKAAQSDLRSTVSTLELCNTDGGYPTAVAETGAMTGCASQNLSLSSGTKLRYVLASGAYTVYAKNDGGDAVYCYASGSTAGGGVKRVTSPASATLANATCA